MPERCYYAVGQFAGQDLSLVGEHDRGHRIRVGDRIERVVAEVRFAVWDHFRLSATDSGPAPTSSLLGVPVDDDSSESVRDLLAASVEHLVDRGLLLEEPLNTSDLSAMATSYRGYPLLSGLEEYADEPRSYRVGIPGAYAVDLTADQFELWTLLPRVATIAELAALLHERAEARGDSDVGAGAQLLRRTVNRVAELAALRVACLDRT